MKKRWLTGMVGIALVAGFALAGFKIASAHCEIPCGIYDDPLRLKLVVEHSRTIEKSMNNIIKLKDASTPVDINQRIRWTSNKELHANKIQEIVSQYFLTQRIKHPGKGDEEAMKTYFRQLELLHQMLVSSMQAKQTVDPKHTEDIRKQVEEFKKAYGLKEEKEHSH